MSALASEWATWMLERGWCATVAVLAVLPLCALLHRRASAHALSWLALLPLVLLVLPLERWLPPIIPALPRPQWIAPQVEAPRLPTETTTPAASTHLRAEAEAPSSLATSPADATFAAELERESPAHDALAWIFALWCLGCAASVVHGVVQELRSRRFLARASRPAPPAAWRRFERLQLWSGQRARVALRCVPGLASPATGGLLRPTVYAPQRLFEELRADELRWVLLHELAHVRRGDVWIALFERAVLAAWFFHPVAWIARALAARWREYACDEAAAAALGPSARRASAAALFRVLSWSVEAHATRASLPSLFPSRSFVRSRLMRLLDATRAPQRALTFCGLLLLVLSGSAVLALSRMQDLQDEALLAPSSNPDASAARTAAALWLARHQQSDGRWTVSGDPGVRTQLEINEIHTTALAVRALLAELPATASDAPEIEAAMRRGIGFLESSQSDDGCFGPQGDFATTYAQAQALRALCAAEARLPDPDRRERMRRSVEFILKTRNPYKGWRYATVPNGENDSKITGLTLVALAEAEARGAIVDPAVFHGGFAVLCELTDTATGRTGLVQRGAPAPRYQKKRDAFPPAYSEEPTALQLLAHSAGKKGFLATEELNRSRELLGDCLPLWSTARGSLDYPYWMYGAEAIARTDGPDAATWRAALHEALLPHRVSSSDGTAHWPAIDAWCEPGMEPYATAAALLALQSL